MSTNIEDEKLLRLVNNSGFPFQLRVAQEIVSSASAYPWNVVAQEHPWRDADTGRAGFIDLIIGRYDVPRMVIECKRTRDADWVFLLPEDGRGKTGTHARCMWISAPENAEQAQIGSGWHDFYTTPESFISEFCIVRGTGENQKPMLENLCGQLLDSVECFAREEITLTLGRNRSITRYYVPVIVTNAQLSVCSFDLKSISLNDGEVPKGIFETVPYIRFRKSLTTKLTDASRIDTVDRANRDRQRTVIVVQAEHLLAFLERWQVNPERVPWA